MKQSRAYLAALAAGLLIALPCTDTIAAGVFPIATNTGTVGNPGGVEQAINLAFDGTNYLVGIQGDETADDSINAQLVGPTGALVGSRIKVGRNGGAPSVAFDGTNYLLVWTEGSFGSPNTVKFQFLNPSLQALGQPFEMFATQGSNWPFIAAAVFNGTRFAVVATLANLDVNFNFLSGDVYGTFIPKSTAPPRLDVAGPRVGTQFPLRLSGTPGIDYTIQKSTTLGTADWTALTTTAVSPTTGTLDLTDTGATTSRRFYRRQNRETESTGS